MLYCFKLSTTSLGFSIFEIVFQSDIAVLLGFEVLVKRLNPFDQVVCKLQHSSFNVFYSEVKHFHGFSCSHKAYSAWGVNLKAAGRFRKP